MTSSVSAQSKFRVGVAGLNHDHIYNILNDYSKGRVYLVGIAEPNKHLWEKYGKIELRTAAIRPSCSRLNLGQNATFGASRAFRPV